MEKITQLAPTNFDLEGLREFYASLFTEEDRPDIVVAIARKMPRLLEYLMGEEDIPFAIVTERALPWISEDITGNRKLLFCDDILNVGTTLLHYIHYAQKNNLGNIKAKIYAERNKNREFHRNPVFSGIDISYFRSFDDATYQQFETLLPQQLLTLGKPYDVDFPIISLHLSQDLAEKSIEDWLDLLNKHFRSVHNLTTLSQRLAGITSLSVIEPFNFDIKNFLPACEDPSFAIMKARLYISKNECLMRVVPMCIPQIPEPKLNKLDDIFFDKELNQLFIFLAKKAKAGDPFEFEPRYNLLVYLLSFEFGRLFIKYISDRVINDFSPDLMLDQVDLTFIFGKEIAEELKSFLLKRLTNTLIITSNSRDCICPSYLSKRFLKERLARAVLDELTKSGYKGSQTVDIINAAAFIIDRLASINTPDDNKLPEYMRLRNGLPLCDFWKISSEMSDPEEQPTFEHMSFFLDYFIDLGVLIPVVEKIGDTYWRTYRKGEATPLAFAEFIHWILNEHKKIFPDKPLNKVFFTKIIAALAIYHPDKLPVKPVFEFRGTVPYMQSSHYITSETERAVEFLERKRVIIFEKQKEDSDQLTLIV